MSWQFIMVLRIAVTSVFYSVLVKKVADLPSKTWNQFFIYSFCIIFSGLFVLISKDFVFRYSLLLVVGIGLLNSVAVFSNIRAINISLSKTSVLMPFTSIMAIMLGYIFLNEIQFLNNALLLGISLCFLSSILFIYRGKKQDDPLKLSQNKQLLIWITILSIIWGFITFAMRYFALEGFTPTEFILCWYFGSWVGAILLLLPNRKKENPSLNKKRIFGIFLLALIIWISLLFSYYILKLIPIIIAQPIFMVSEIIFPVIVGLFWFKEIKKITYIEIIAILIGISGGIIIGFSF